MPELSKFVVKCPVCEKVDILRTEGMCDDCREKTDDEAYEAAFGDKIYGSGE